MMRNALNESDWENYEELYRRVTRDRAFFQMVVDDARRSCMGGALRILDVGCGGGFHHNVELQRSIAELCENFIGVEPDPRAKVDACFTRVLRTSLELAEIAPASVDIAYSSMVLEHVADPESHFNKIYEVLRPGGVFWGFTVDKRHWFATASAFFERVGLKESYLRRLHGRRGMDRYENFPTRYLCNSPRDMQKYAKKFSVAQFRSLHKEGQMDFYVPAMFHPVAHVLDRVTLWARLPGSVLVVRLVK